MIFGNSPQQKNLRENLMGPKGPISLTGSAHVGKFSLAKELIEELVHPSDFLIMGDGIESAREVVSFCSSNPLHSTKRVVLVDDAGSLSEPAQDALLKITEEPHPAMKVVVVCHDVGNVQPAFRSRLRYEIGFGRLIPTEMRDFAATVASVVDEDILKLSQGMPGIYTVMMNNSGFEDLFSFSSRIAQGVSDPFLLPTPDLVKNLKGAGPIRDAIASIIHLASRTGSDTSKMIHLMDFSSLLIRHPSANADIHWQRMAANISGCNL